MDDKTKDYLEIIKTGTVREIEEFTRVHFHRIKHTDSFYALIGRLENMEKMTNCLKSECEKWRKKESRSFLKYVILSNLLTGHTNLKEIKLRLIQEIVCKLETSTPDEEKNMWKNLMGIDWKE